jgi:8-oxo-dGTP pyrophosphatase MutT (NUDIX family)
LNQPAQHLSLPHIGQRLSEHQPVVLETGRFARKAAVATILRKDRGHTEVLFIKRAQRPGDIWSGHMAFPGGHWESGDDDLVATAIRETREEIGLDLGQHGRLLGHLDYLDVNPIGTRINMLVVPFVFALEASPPALALNHEVAAVHWGSLADMFHGRSATNRDMHVRSGSKNFPGYEVQNEIVWGLTYRMLHGFFASIDPAWRHSDDSDR